MMRGIAIFNKPVFCLSQSRVTMKKACKAQFQILSSVQCSLGDLDKKG